MYFVWPSVSNAMGEFWILSAAIKDGEQIFSFKIAKTYAHQVYTLFCPSVCRSLFKSQKHYFVKVPWSPCEILHITSLSFLLMTTEHVLYNPLRYIMFYASISKFSIKILFISNVLFYGCFHPCLIIIFIIIYLLWFR